MLAFIKKNLVIELVCGYPPKRYFLTAKWVKVFKNGPSKICGRLPLKKLK